MKFGQIIAIFMLVLVTGCAQVPKEAVELSTTVGRDLAEMRKSHTALVKLYYEGLLTNVNQFIDDVYLPYQIQRTLADNAIKQDMLATIEAASRADATGQRQKEAFEKLKLFHQLIHEEVEDYRKLKLAPIYQQYKTVLDSINQSYEQIHYANSIVTGHLASVVKVHDTQSKLLEKLNLENMRTRVGTNLADLSGQIAELTAKAREKESDLEAIVAKFEEVAETVK